MTKRKYPDPRPTAVDLFCGAGGMSLGFEQAGFDILLGVDADGHHVATHERNFPCGKAVCMSVAGLDAARIRELAGVSGEIDLVFGGPPCQGFSSMGHRDKHDARNTLVDEFVRIVLDVRPRAVVMENVPGMGSGETGQVLRRAVAALECGGYRITKPIRKLLASDFGVPQDRVRLFVLGVRGDVADGIAYPEGPPEGQPPRPAVHDAIADLPRIEKDEDLFRRDSVPYDRPPVSPYARVARGVDPDPSDLSIPRLWDQAVCSGCMRTRHSQSTIDLYDAVPPGGTAPGHKLPRLDPRGLAPTLRAGSDSAHGSYTAPRPIHPYLPRCITAREAARLHGYPDWFSFFPTKWHGCKQIGNSVCPPVARAIGRKVAEALGVKFDAKAPCPVQLGDEFKLPNNRPRHQRRIPQLAQYGPVVAELFRNAFDAEVKALRRPRFTFDDVRAAVGATGVDLHWSRPDTFLDEIRRSRNVQRILAAPLRHGYSIRPVADGDGIGEFVPCGEPGCIDVKEALDAKAADLSAAVPLGQSSELLRNLPSNAEFLLNVDEVRRKLWPAGVDKVVAEWDAFPSLRAAGCTLQLLKPKGRPQHCYAMIAASDGVPAAARVYTAARSKGANDVLTLTALTAKHLLVDRFRLRGERAEQVARCVFVLSLVPAADIDERDLVSTSHAAASTGRGAAAGVWAAPLR